MNSLNPVWIPDHYFLDKEQGREVEKLDLTYWYKSNRWKQTRRQIGSNHQNIRILGDLENWVPLTCICLVKRWVWGSQCICQSVALTKRWELNEVMFSLPPVGFTHISSADMLPWTNINLRWRNVRMILAAKQNQRWKGQVSIFFYPGIWTVHWCDLKSKIFKYYWMREFEGQAKRSLSIIVQRNGGLCGSLI